MSINTGDPYRDSTIYEAIQCEKEKNQPHCCICGEAIWDDKLWDFIDAIYCEECAEAQFKKNTEDYIRNGNFI